MPTFKKHTNHPSRQEPSFYWYDTETTGLKQRYDRVVQFAGLRTNQNLEPIGEPLTTYVQLPPEVVPSAESIRLTKISLSTLAEQGIPEHELFRTLQSELQQNDTCIIGYNNLSFDNQMVRMGMYRTLLPPYEHEYKRGNSKLDFLNIVQLAGALRREGFEWPTLDGEPTYKLEHIAAANNIPTDDAHDALVDVQMTLTLARKLKTAQPRLWAYACRFREKAAAKKLLRPEAKQFVLHISRVYGNARSCIAPVLPMTKHPRNQNQVVVVDLASNVELLHKLSVDELRKLLFERDESKAKTDEDPAERLNISAVGVNRNPMLATIKTLLPENIKYLNYDMKKIEKNASRLLRDPNMPRKLSRLFGEHPIHEQPKTAEEALYEKFISNEDQQECSRLWKRLERKQPWEDAKFDDPRLSELQSRLKTRVLPNKLSESEQDQYRQFIRQQIVREERNVFDEQKAIEELLKEERTATEVLVLKELRNYLRGLVAEYDLEPTS